MSKEHFEFDKSFKRLIVGTDEAGRGPGAGPVFAAAVYFPKIDDGICCLLSELNDSKKLSEKKREDLFEVIKQNSIYSIKSSSVEEIEKLNILQASLLAMKKACEDVIKKSTLTEPLIFVDGNKLIPKFDFEQRYIVKGDSLSASIAAASILAKVERDHFMHNLHKQFPQYCWDKNKGYLTKAHIEGIRNFGLTKWHRKKFVRKLEI